MKKIGLYTMLMIVAFVLGYAIGGPSRSLEQLKKDFGKYREIRSREMVCAEHYYYDLYLREVLLKNGCASECRKWIEYMVGEVAEDDGMRLEDGIMLHINAVGVLMDEMGDYKAARELAERTYHRFRDCREDYIYEGKGCGLFMEEYYLTIMGRIYFEEGRYPEVLKYFEQLNNLRPEIESAHPIDDPLQEPAKCLKYHRWIPQKIAACYERLGNHAKAEQLHRQVASHGAQPCLCR